MLGHFINKFTSVHIKYQDLNFNKAIFCTKVATSYYYFVIPNHDKLILQVFYQAWKLQPRCLNCITFIFSFI